MVGSSKRCQILIRWSWGVDRASWKTPCLPATTWGQLCPCVYKIGVKTVCMPLNKWHKWQIQFIDIIAVTNLYHYLVWIMVIKSFAVVSIYPFVSLPLVPLLHDITIPHDGRGGGWYTGLLVIQSSVHRHLIGRFTDLKLSQNEIWLNRRSRDTCIDVVSAQLPYQSGLTDTTATHE